MILTHCAYAIDEYSFRLKNATAQQAYDDAQVDWNTFTNVRLQFSLVNDTENVLELDISDSFEYLFECNGGLVINFDDFMVDTFNGYDYFPDALYQTKILYVYNGVEYTSVVSTGFKPIISRIVYQQVQQADWKKELHCSCDCMDNNSVLRKYHYLQMMQISAELCLINNWYDMLKALYKLTGTNYEFSEL